MAFATSSQGARELLNLPLFLFAKEGSKCTFCDMFSDGWDGLRVRVKNVLTSADLRF